MATNSKTKSKSSRPNNLLQYGRNVGRSLVYTSVDVIKDMNPVLKAFADNNAELGKEVFAAVKDYKGTIAKGKKVVVENQYVKLFNTARKNFIDDLKTGNWYNLEREDSMFDDAFDDDDWGWSGIDDNFLDDDNDEYDTELSISETEQIKNEMNSVGEAATNAIVRATNTSADYIVQNNHIAYKSMMEQNKKHFAQVNLNLAALNSNLINLTQLGKPITDHINNSATFYNKMTDYAEQSTKLLQEILDATKANGVQKKEDKSDVHYDYNNIMSDGAIDIKKYFGNIQHNIKNKMGSTNSLFGIDIGGANIMEAMVSKPIASIIQHFMEEAIPKEIKKATEEFQSTFSDVIAGKLMNLNTKANDDNSPIYKFLNDILGVSFSRGSDLNPANYEKGKVDFDGITRKSITEVIPTYLAKILASVSGEEELRFDYNKGKFEKVSNIRRNKDADDDSYFNSAVNKFKRQGEKYVDRLKMSGRERRDFNDDFDKFLYYLYNNAESFMYKNKHIDGSKYGISDESMEIIRYIFLTNEKTGKKNLNTSLNSSIANNISREYAASEYNGKKGDNVYLNLLNDSLGYNPDTKFDSAEYYKKMKSKLLVDEDGNDIFFYLRQYYKDFGLMSGIIKDFYIDGVYVNGLSGPVGTNGSTGSNGSDFKSKANHRKAFVDRIEKERKNATSRLVETRNEKNQKLQQKYADKWIYDIIKNTGGDPELYFGADVDVIGDFESSLKASKKANKKVKKGRQRDKRNEAIENYIKNNFDRSITTNPDYVNQSKREIIDDINRRYDEDLEYMYEKKGFDYEYTSRGDDKFDAEEASDVQKLIYESNILDKNSKKKDSIFKRLANAKNVNEKYKTLMEGLDDLSQKPAKMLTSIIHKADERLYNILYGEETGDEEESFIGLLKKRLNETFDEVLNKADSTWDKIKDGINGFMKKSFGYDFGDIKEGFNSWLWGEEDEGTGERSGGVLGDFVRGTRDSLKEMWKNSVSDPFNSWVEDRPPDEPKPKKDNTTSNAATGGKVTKTGVIAVTGGEYIIPAPGNKKEQLRKENEAKRKFLNYAKGRGKGDNFEYLGNYAGGNLDDPNGIPGEGRVVSIDEDDLAEHENILRQIIASKKFTKGKGKNGKKHYTIDEDELLNNDFLSNLILGNDIKFDSIQKTKNKAIDKSREVQEAIQEKYEKGKAVVSDALMDMIPEDSRSTVSEIMGEAGKNAGTMGAGALLGGGISWLTGLAGGPILGAAVGSALALINKSEEIQNMLFKDTIDKDGKTKEGILKDEESFLKNKMPDIVKFGLGGRLAGMLIGGPILGPIIGTTLGAAIGYAKNTDEIKNAFFGKGSIAEGMEEKLKKALPKAGIGAVGGLLFGPLPIGLVGNAMIGAALGFASDSEKFRDLMFGKKDSITGERSGGIAGTLSKKFVAPLVDFAKNYIVDTKTFFTEKVFQPIEEVMKPIAARSRNRKHRIADKLKAKAGKQLKKMGASIAKVAGRRIGKGLKKIGGGIGNGVSWLATRIPMAKLIVEGGLFKFPFWALGKAAGGIDKHMRNKDTRQGYNDYEDIQAQLQRSYDISAYSSTEGAQQLFDDNGNINQDFLNKNTQGASLNALMNMDEDKRKEFINQMAFRQDGMRSVGKYLDKTYKTRRKEAIDNIEHLNVGVVGESKIRKALEQAGEKYTGEFGKVNAESEKDFDKILRENLPWMKRGAKPTKEQKEATKRLKKLFRDQLETRKSLDSMGNSDASIDQTLAEMGINENQMGEAKEYLGRMSSVLNNSESFDRVFGEFDRNRSNENIKNEFFSKFVSDQGRYKGKKDKNQAIINKLNNGEELDDNEKKILSKYIKNHINTLDGNDKANDLREYLFRLNDDLTGKENSLEDVINKPGSNPELKNINNIKIGVQNMLDTNEKSESHLSKLLNNSNKELKALLRIAGKLTGDQSLLNEAASINIGEDDNNDIIFDDNGNPIIDENEIKNHAFGGKTSAGLAVVTKGEEITSKSEHLLSNIRDMLYKKFNEAEYVTTDRGGIVRLRRDANGEIVTDVRDKDTQASIENANQDTNLLKEISKKLDNVGFGGGNKNPDDDDENKDDKSDKDDDNNLLDIVKNIKDNITDWGAKLLGIGGAISSALTTLGGGIPEIVEAIDNIVVPVAATGALDEVAEEADPEEYKTYTDYSGNEFGESLSDKARWNLLKRGAYKLAGWDFNGPKKIGKFIGKIVRKRQTKKLLKKQDKARRLINEYKRLSDGVETTEDITRTSRKITNIDDAIRYMDNVDNAVDGVEAATRTADNVSDISKASKKAVKAAKRAEKYERSMNRIKNLKSKSMETFNKYIAKITDFLKSLANIVGNKCPKIKKIFETFVEKIYKPLKDAFKKASESKLGKALKVVGKVLTVAMVVIDFTNGCKKAGKYFKVTDDRVTPAMRVISGSANAILQFFLLTMWIHTDWVIEALVKAAELVDADWAKDLRVKQEESQEDLQEYRDDVGDQTITMDEFNSRFYNANTVIDDIVSGHATYKKRKSLEKTIETKKQKGEDTSSEEYQLKLMDYQSELNSIANMSATYDKDLENLGLKMYPKVFKSTRGPLSKDGILKMNMKLDGLVRGLSNNKTRNVSQEFDKVYPKKKDPSEYLVILGSANEYKYEIPKNVKDLPKTKKIMLYGVKVNNDGTWIKSKGNIEDLQGRTYESSSNSSNKLTVTSTNKVTKEQTTEYNNSIIEMEKRDNVDYNGNFMIGSGSKLDTIQKKTGTFISQLDPSIANKKFTKNTTFGQNACGPAVASMIINSAKSNTIDIKDAAKFATVGKYANDQGTDSKYFKDLLGTYGIHTNYMDNTKGTKLRDIKEQIAKGNEVVLLGSDSKNKNKRNSPFGSSDHYVLATGIDKSGNIIVNDPESDRPMKYSSKILKNVKLGIGTDAIRGSGSFRGGTITNSNDVVDTDIAQKIYGYLTSNGYSPSAAAGIMGNLEQESHLDTGAVNGDGSNSTGIAQWKDGRLTAMQQNAASMGYDWHELDPQLDWLNKEINGADSTTIDNFNKHWGGLEAFKNTNDAAWAADAFMQSFERCSTDPEESNIAGRTKWAKQYYEMYSGTPYEGTYTPSEPTGAVSTDTGTSGNSDGSSFDFSNGDTDIISAIGSLFTDTILDGIKSTFGQLSSIIGWDTSDGNNSSTTDYTSGSYSSGDSAELANLPKGDPNTIVAYAKSKINKLQYLYGSTDVDNGVSDCSGFAQWAVKKATGIDPGRDTAAMYTNSEGSDVSTGSLDESQLQPGDLLLYRRNNSKKIDGVGHVEIYEGNGKMIGNGGPNNGDIGATEKNVTNNNFLKAKRFVTYTPTESRTTSSYEVQDGYSHYMDSRASNNTETTTDTNTDDTFDFLNELNGSGSGLKSTLFTGSNSSSTNTNSSTTIKTNNNTSSNVSSNDYTRFSTSSSERSLLDAVMGKSTNNISSVVKALSEVIDRLATISTNTEINAKIYEVLVNYLKDMVNGNNTIIATNGNNSNNINASNSDSLKELSSLLNIIAAK